MIAAITRRRPGVAARAGFAADGFRGVIANWKGTRMPLSRKLSLVAMLACAVSSGAGYAQSTDTTTTATPTADPALAQSSSYQYGVFRESVANAPVSQRNCWVQGLISGQTINGDLLTERVTLTQAQCVLNYLTQRGQCASERTTPYWSARQDNSSNNQSGSNNWQNGNTSQGGGTSGGWASQNGGGGGGQQGGWHNSGGSNGGGSNSGGSDTGGSQNSGQWTRGGEWSGHGGISPTQISTICGGGGTTSSSTSGTSGGTGSGTTSN
jgi:hypothetical protein